MFFSVFEMRKLTSRRVENSFKVKEFINYKAGVSER